MMLRCWTAALLLGTVAWSPASSHPHVFIDAHAAFEFNDAGDLSALRITWIYDAFTSLSLISLLDLDKDNDGILSAPDLARVVQAQTIWPDDFAGDTYLEASGAPVSLGRPINGTAAMVENRITVSFDLPLEAPLRLDATAELRLYDPTYYYAYATVDVQPAENCDVALRKFEPDRAAFNLKKKLSRLSREETPEQKGVGRLFADVIELQCA